MKTEYIVGHRRLSKGETEKRNKKIIELYNQGITDANIGSQFRLSGASVSRLINRLRKTGKYTIQAPTGKHAQLKT